MTRVPSGRRAKSRRRGSSASIQPILDAIARTAARLCEANDALILLVEGDRAAVVASHGLLPMRLKLGETYPLSADLVGNRAITQRRTIHIRDLAGTAAARVTSYALSGDEAKALAADADAYVSKPFSPRALLAKVREYLPS